MVYALNYTRPHHVSSSSNGSISGSEKASSFKDSVHSGHSTSSHGIPDALSFDRIMSGGTCPVSNLTPGKRLIGADKLISLSPSATSWTF